MAQPRNNSLPQEKPQKEATITMTQADLQSMIASAVSAAVGATQQSQIPKEATSDFKIRCEQDFNNRMLDNERLAQTIAGEEKVPFCINQIYAAYLGDTVTASVNGQTITIPVDGVTRYIPARYAPILAQYVHNVDRKVAAMNAVNSEGTYGGVAEIKNI